jgi:HAD superfamily hydrolase (TIGR01458 family)
MDGVLYVGEQPVAGAREALEWLNDRSIPYLFLTNTTSRPRSMLAKKLQSMGMDVGPERILTPAVAATEWLQGHKQGRVGLFVPEATRTEFDSLELAETGDTGPVEVVVVGDYGEKWTFQALNQAFRWLMQEPRPALIALGMTRYWRAEDGLRLDTAPFVMALQHASGTSPLVMGKPAQAFFEMALKRLGRSASETLMIGDDIRSDIDGAQQAGIRGLQVKTGKFSPSDLQGEIRPAAVLDSFADLPQWWESP